MKSSSGLGFCFENDFWWMWYNRILNEKLHPLPLKEVVVIKVTINFISLFFKARDSLYLTSTEWYLTKNKQTSKQTLNTNKQEEAECHSVPCGPFFPRQTTRPTINTLLHLIFFSSLSNLNFFYISNTMLRSNNLCIIKRIFLVKSILEMQMHIHIPIENCQMDGFRDWDRHK